MKKLVDDIEHLTAHVEGKWSIVIEDVKRDERWATLEHERHYAASIIKLPIMAAVYQLFDQDKLHMHDHIVMHKEDLVAGSGVLQHLTPGQSFTIEDLVMLMIIQSDNTATNLLIDYIGIQAIQETMQYIGMADSSFYNKLMIVPEKRSGSNLITANDIAKFLKVITQGDFSSVYACQHMIAVMKKQQIHYLTAKLPEPSDDFIGIQPEWEFASKTGNVTGVHHDVGIFYGQKNALNVTVLSSQCDTELALETHAKIGQAIYKHMIK